MDSIRRCSWTPRTRAGKQEHETARQAVLSVTNPNLKKSFDEFLLSGVYDNLLRGDVQ